MQLKNLIGDIFVITIIIIILTVVGFGFLIMKGCQIAEKIGDDGLKNVATEIWDGSQTNK